MGRCPVVLPACKGKAVNQWNCKWQQCIELRIRNNTLAESHGMAGPTLRVTNQLSWFTLWLKPIPLASKLIPTFAVQSEHRRLSDCHSHYLLGEVQSEKIESHSGSCWNYPVHFVEGYTERLYKGMENGIFQSLPVQLFIKYNHLLQTIELIKSH